ncbi:MAG TPA: hypothetical protein VH251_06555 [Verrucomicrobiae bacterium]|nr:hypothetical protein [Verrucomicrobiae bacterium]
MNLRNIAENRDWTFANADSAPKGSGRVLLAATLVMAGAGAAAAPLLADLLSAGAGVLIVSLAFAAWTSARQGGGRVGTTNMLEAV